MGSRFAEPPNARCRGMAALRAARTDHLRVYTEHLHAKGIKCMAEVRMSDTHHRRVAVEERGCPMFTLEHPEWVIKRDDGVPEVAMDYSYPEVRAHRLAIMTELANEYDIDGLELNFNRWAKHFERRRGREKAQIMTAFVAQIHEMLRAAATRRGKDRLLLGVRVLSTVEECWQAGCDPETWVRNGWIDYLIVAEHNCTWPGTRVDEFRPFCEGRCGLYVQLGDMIGGVWKGKPRITGRGIAHVRDGYNGMVNTDAEARAAAHNFYAWGADGIAFWNISCNIGTQGKWGGPEQRRRMFGWMSSVVTPEAASATPRVYHYVPLYKGITAVGPRNYACQKELHSPHGAHKGQALRFGPGEDNRTGSFHFRMADGRGGEELRGRLRFRVLELDPGNAIQVAINGSAVASHAVRQAPDPDNPDIRAAWFCIELADCPPFRGDNELQLTLLGPLAPPFPVMEELEITVE